MVCLLQRVIKSNPKTFLSFSLVTLFHLIGGSFKFILFIYLSSNDYIQPGQPTGGGQLGHFALGPTLLGAQ